MLSERFLKPYNPQETESRIYKLWEESGFFNPDSLPSVGADSRGLYAEERGKKTKRYTLYAKRFCMLMPPPNATGVLHMGHALMLTLQDILVRYKRMRGFRTLAREFEDAVTEVLVAKAKTALEQYGATALLIGGGVIANAHIRRAFEQLATDVDVPLFIPEGNLTTDNALMIAVAGFLRLTQKNGSTEAQNDILTAKGNLTLDKK